MMLMEYKVIGRNKKLFYFYEIQSIKGYDPYPFDYQAEVKRAIGAPNTIWGHPLDFVNKINELKKTMGKAFLLDNGIDVRELYYPGEVKEISKEFFDQLVLDDIKQCARQSDTHNSLLIKFGFDTTSWHKPFVMEAKNKVYLKSAMKRKFGFLPKITFKV
jgi:hypothetical protein